ncbi:MAG: serine hydrolase [Bacteroidota bacterium]
MTINLYNQIDRIAKETGIKNVAISFYDYETSTSWSYKGDVFFHAASTIKVPILIGIFQLIEEGKLKLDSQVHVRNRFISPFNNEPFRVQASRDGNRTVYSSIGRALPVSELAHQMIVTSSNLATNLLVELVGAETLQQKLKRLNINGVEFRRGVEDELAFENGINNMVTANGLTKLFRYLHESDEIATELSDKMIDILRQQKFNQGIPVGVPKDLRKQSIFAHKTGEISMVAHDTGLAYLPERNPYALTILTERVPGESKSRRAIQRISRLVYKNFIGTEIHELEEHEV